MKIVVTGGCGFIGSYVVNEALSIGHEVMVIDNLTYAASMANLPAQNSSKNYSFAKLDISNITSVRRVVMDFQPDSIIHLAAETHVDRSISDSSLFISTNIVGTYNLLEAFRNLIEVSTSDNKRFIHVSTDEVFGSLNLSATEKFTEYSRYAPRSPYAASKASSDHLVRAWHETYNLPVIITNCSNNYGPYQFPEKLIPLTIINALRGLRIPIYGNGLNIRDWLHVADHAKAILQLLKSGQSGETYNIGAQNERANIDIVHAVFEILATIKNKTSAEYLSLIEFVADRKGHDVRYAIDPSKIIHEIGWKPKISFEAGLRNTIEWYCNNQSWWGNFKG